MTKPSEELLIESGKTQTGGESITEMMRRMLAMIGEDPNREGLRKTPERFEKALRYLTSGYHQDSERGDVQRLLRRDGGGEGH